MRRANWLAASSISTTRAAPVSSPAPSSARSPALPQAAPGRIKMADGTQAGRAPSPQRGEGWGERDTASRDSTSHLNELTATEIVRRTNARESTAAEVVSDCVSRIAAREPTVHAFAHIDPELAM